MAAFVGLEVVSASYYEGTWVPAGNDSFYHARRILDAAYSERGFYQFDDMIHVPEGSWVTWPWAYDWMMAKALRAWQFVSPATDAMAFLTHVPLYWVFLNALILLGIANLMGLPAFWIAFVLLGFALSPLTQLLHGVGVIDHHYVELTFVLLTVFGGLWWLREPDKAIRAAFLGIVLGAAPAFHNGLFILQAPLLVTLFIFWLRDELPPPDSMLTLATSLILTMLLALLPSEPFREGQFQFSVLSWFHLYIAATSTLVIAGLARYRFSLKNLLFLGLLGLLLLIPIWADTIGGTAFLTRKITLLSRVSEAQSPFQWSLANAETFSVTTFYSWLGVIAPLLPLLFLWRLWKTRSHVEFYFGVMLIFGIGLAMTQFRLHYFGSFALILGWAVLINHYFPGINARPRITLLAYLPPIQSRIFVPYSLGFDGDYEELYPILLDAQKACTEQPGVILVDNNLGHIVRYHTDCSVIANNFLMTPQHEDKIAEMNTLLTTFATTEWLEKNIKPLQFQLTSRKDLPERFEMLAELPIGDGQRDIAMARLLRVAPEITVGD
jgi:asparagine N-glycosylation enzyme membrane subunit Stt3